MKYNLTIVNYINTYPFLEALRHPNLPFNVVEKIPRLCGEDFINGNADIALIPCGFLPKLQDIPHKILDQYGIACEGEVRTVKLLSRVPLDQIETIVLDNHSTSSSQLLKVLCKHHWKLSPNYTTQEIENVDAIESALMIGDKVFEFESGFDFAYDLGEAWQNFTGLPFVFAIWVAKPEVPKSVTDKLYAQFDQGINKIDLTIKKFQNKFPNIDLESYLGSHIHFRLNESYLDGLHRYLDLLKVRSLAT